LRFVLGAMLVIAAMAASSARAQESVDPLDALVRAYPEALAGRSGNAILFRDGTRLDAGKADTGVPFEQLLTQASIRDMFLIAYPAGTPSQPPVENFDPGRFRNKAFFDYLYGDCRRDEVRRNLVSLVWLPKTWGRKIEVTRINGVDAQLRQVSAEIDALPLEIKRAAYPVAGTYACRGVADNGQPSMHAYGAAIDLNLAYSDYWLWDAGKKTRQIPYRNRMPPAIVAIFRRHGFIWGGAWYHYDTMHFEYRPELLVR